MEIFVRPESPSGQGLLLRVDRSGSPRPAKGGPAPAQRKPLGKVVIDVERDSRARPFFRLRLFRRSGALRFSVAQFRAGGAPADPRRPRPALGKRAFARALGPPLQRAEAEEALLKDFSTRKDRWLPPRKARTRGPAREPRAQAGAAPLKNSARPFAKLEKVIAQVFLGEEVGPGTPGLPRAQGRVLRLLLRRKGFPEAREKALDAAALTRLAQAQLDNRKRPGPEFVFAECLRHLKARFARECPAQGPSDSQEAAGLQGEDGRFFSHYFGGAARETGTPLRRFFWEGLGPAEVPLPLWARSPRFVADALAFLDSGFEAAFAARTRARVSEMVRRWEVLARAQGLDQALASVARTLSSRNCRLPWTLCEARRAVRDAREALAPRTP